MLKLTVGVNYICCSTFKATQTIDGNNITLSITETTASPDLYCRCTSYYTFDFYYTDIVYDSYVVKVIFDSLDDTKDKSSTTTINVKKSWIFVEKTDFCYCLWRQSCFWVDVIRISHLLLTVNENNITIFWRHYSFIYRFGRYYRFRFCFRPNSSLLRLFSFRLIGPSCHSRIFIEKRWYCKQTIHQYFGLWYN